MKKFCSKCGSQLDLGKKSCPECHAFNPFFIAGYTNPTPDKHVPVVEVHEEVVVTEEPKIETQAIVAEQTEREKIELNLKHELLRVKEETEQYKKETLDLVNGVKRDLEDIDKENKLLKEKVEQLNSTRHMEVAEPVLAPVPVKEKTGLSGRAIAIAAGLIAILLAGFSYVVLNSHDDNKSANATPNVQPTVSHSTVVPIKKEEQPVTVADTTHTQKLLAVVTPSAEKPKPASTIPATAAPVPVATKPTATTFSLSAARVMGDLVGKKLSGCDITINSASEIDHVDNLVLVEKLSAFYLKYKCTVKIKQGAETYTASPYIYYSAEGTFIKVDGTNCE